MVLEHHKKEKKLFSLSRSSQATAAGHLESSHHRLCFCSGDSLAGPSPPGTFIVLDRKSSLKKAIAVGEVQMYSSRTAIAYGMYLAVYTSILLSELSGAFERSLLLWVKHGMWVSYSDIL